MKNVVPMEQDDITPLHWGAENGFDKMVEFHLSETHVDLQVLVSLGVANEHACAVMANPSEMLLCVCWADELQNQIGCVLVSRFCLPQFGHSCILMLLCVCDKSKKCCLLPCT